MTANRRTLGLLVYCASAYNGLTPEACTQALKTAGADDSEAQAIRKQFEARLLPVLTQRDAFPFLGVGRKASRRQAAAFLMGALDYRQTDDRASDIKRLMLSMS